MSEALLSSIFCLSQINLRLLFLYLHMNNQKKNTYLSLFGASVLIGLLLSITACSDDYTPKPKAYPRVEFPSHAYEPYHPQKCPFSFEKPTYATIERDSIFLKKEKANPCWLNIKYPDFNATIYLSYKNIDKQNSLEKLLEDAHTLNSKHVIRASAMEDSLIHTTNNINGLFYYVGGNTATSTQFFLTDSTKNFLWGSLYFYTQPNEDSLAPIVKFIRKDIDQLISSFKWQ